MVVCVIVLLDIDNGSMRHSMLFSVPLLLSQCDKVCLKSVKATRWSKRIARDTAVCLNPLNTKRRRLYLKTQFVLRSKHFSSRL